MKKHGCEGSAPPFLFWKARVLSNLREGQVSLEGAVRGVWWGSKGFVQPSPEIPVDEEIEAQEGDQVRQTPGQGAAHLQVLQEQDGDQCCPNLNVHRVRARAHEGLDLQVLLERL